VPEPRKQRTENATGYISGRYLRHCGVTQLLVFAPRAEDGRSDIVEVPVDAIEAVVLHKYVRENGYMFSGSVPYETAGCRASSPSACALRIE
jgi:hypothetical protein